uniref:Large ribosomal subunit protein bL32c n=1 Tax=Monsonia speciosa TaxID=163694 RepID=B7T3T9_9ROSI|nr:ribosomal protein L32 [Monsonia speciosa]YP_003934361.1 ribosomal protein L32 [Monsonia speciosa]ACH47389.1 ribosomal protein L32 [Monsonia speciosa]ADJ66484.1 ribosomal protein L32 [Monsonia speciosa]ADJ66496.1 ribosomal protein L32 [Monsonia speciosa]
MAVPKKGISRSKKRVRKNIWKGKGSGAALKAFSLAKSFSTGKSKGFVFCDKSDKKEIKKARRRVQGFTPQKNFDLTREVKSQ